MKKISTVILSACLLSSVIASSFYSAELLSAKTVKGDINGDGALNSADAVHLNNVFFGKKTNTDISQFDINGDGKMNILDLITFKSILTGTVSEDGFEITDGVLTAYKGSDRIVKIPDTVTEIAEHAFWSNDEITAVYIPGTVKKIGESAFWSCSSLEFIDIAEGVETIGNTVTWSCPSLKDVNLPSTIKVSEKDKDMCDMFDNCPLVTFHLPASAEGKNTDSEWIASHTFIRSDGWAPAKYDFTPAKYTPSETGSVIAPAAYQYGKFEEFTIPEGTESIGARAFEYCKKLKSITIPGSVKTIGGDAFQYCEALTDVYICEGCETLNYRTFGYCRALENVTLPASLTSIDKGTFSSSTEKLVIHCPKGSYAEKFAKENKIKFDNKVTETPQTPAVTTADPVITTAPEVTITAKPGTTGTVTTVKPAVTEAKVTTSDKPAVTSVTTTVKPAVTSAPTATTAVTTTVTETSPAKPFNIKTSAKFEVTSKNLNGGVWDDVISNTSRGSNSSPELSWAAVDGASCYAIYMIDTSAGNWMHWKSANVTAAELKTGWAKRSEYVGPYPPSGTHRYEIYIFALKDKVSSMSGNFDDENAGIETLAKSLDKTSEGEVGNIISYGHISGTFTH